MNKILYLTVVDKNNEPGIYKKVTAQTKALRNLGCKVDITYLDGEQFKVNDDSLGKEKQSHLIRLKNRFVYPKALCNYLTDPSNHYDVVYIRKSFINGSFINALKVIKGRGTKVVLEVPTYPYRNELNFINKVLYTWEYCHLGMLKACVDLVTYIGVEDLDVFNIPSIRFYNGIDVSSVKVKQDNIDNKTIRFIAVANLAEWHGYERFFVAMANCSENVEFHIVGEGPALATLKKSAKELGVESSVYFHGNKLGRELDSLFDLCHIGVDSLAMYKANLFVSSSLKTREYAARGIPFILGCEDRDFKENCQFVYNVPNDDSEIDIQDIVKWYNYSNFNKSMIRDFAQENLDWSGIMKPIKSKIFDY